MNNLAKKLNPEPLAKPKIKKIKKVPEKQEDTVDGLDSLDGLDGLDGLFEKYFGCSQPEENQQKIYVGPDGMPSIFSEVEQSAVLTNLHKEISEEKIAMYSADKIADILAWAAENPNGAAAAMAAIEHSSGVIKNAIAGARTGGAFGAAVGAAVGVGQAGVVEVKALAVNQVIGEVANQAINAAIDAAKNGFGLRYPTMSDEQLQALATGVVILGTHAAFSAKDVLKFASSKLTINTSINAAKNIELDTHILMQENKNISKGHYNKVEVDKINDAFKKVDGVDTNVGAKNYNNHDFEHLHAKKQVIDNPYLTKDYIKEVGTITGNKVDDKQITLLKDVLKENQFGKLSPEDKVLHSKKFKALKPKLIEEWEKKMDKKWPTYTQEIINRFNIKNRKVGDAYDAHHLIPQHHAGPNEWWNLHPAMTQEHRLIHGKDGIEKIIFYNTGNK